MADYIKEMREIIGHRPMLLCGAGVIIFDTLGRVLMLHRSDNDCWCFPGGAVELGEELEEAAKREVYEETGLKVENLELFGVFSGEDLHYVYPNGDEVYIIDVVYKTDEYYGDMKINEESKDRSFFNISELPKNISPPVKPTIKKLKKWANCNFNIPKEQN